MNLVLDGLDCRGLGVAPEHLEARVVIIVVIFIIVRGLPITNVAAGRCCCDATASGRKLLLFLSVVIIVSEEGISVGTVSVCLPAPLRIQAAHSVNSVTGARCLIRVILIIASDTRFLEVVLDCTISQIAADGEARTAVLVSAAGPGLCSLQSGSWSLVSVLVSPLTPAPVAAVRAVGGAV